MVEYGKMIHYKKRTKMSPIRVLDEAARFFGAPGQGLSLDERDSHHAYFSGDGSFISIQAVPSNDETEVDLAARGWSFQASEFMARL